MTPNRSARPLRADAARNRLALIDAAKALFATGGDVTLNAIAEAAGVGIGTLYRHFPTREALYEAVYARDIDAIVALGDAAEDGDDPVEDLRRWLYAVIDLVATKKGMIAAMAIASDTSTAISRRFTGRVITALDRRLTRAIATGTLRSDIGAEELFMAVIGMCMLRNETGWQQSARRLVDTLIAGMRA